jgi:folate-binding protein YgfZ
LVDVAAQYGLLSVQGPKSAAVVAKLHLAAALPLEPWTFIAAPAQGAGEIYVMNIARTGRAGFDLYVPIDQLEDMLKAAAAAAETEAGRLVGWDAFETARVEAGIPRFGADMDESNLPPEAGLDAHAVSYNKGCYIGQEIINRIHSFGQVAKALRRLRLADELPALPSRGDVLLHDGKEVGWITSATASPRLKANVALGYVRKEVFAPGTELRLRGPNGESNVQVLGAPFT